MSTYEISKSSLVSLKAEILRKQQVLIKQKAENEIKIKVIKKNTPLEIKKKNKEVKSGIQELNEEDFEALRKSRSALEYKAKLYDKLSKGGKLTEDERNIYLVRFDKKNSSCPNFSDSEDDIDRHNESEEEIFYNKDYPDNDPDNQWVDYTDCLGRTRKCLKKDLEYFKTNDEELKKVVEQKRLEGSIEPENLKQPVNDALPEEKISSEDKDTNKPNEEPELMSDDLRREMLRQQWEKEEEILRNKSNIHYQDILFGEARTHGVGYYNFSTDEEERFKQQEALRKLRLETEQKQKKAQDLKSLREQQLADRIKAAKARKRERLGLPPEPEDTTPPAEDKPTVTEKTEEEKRKEEEKEKLLTEARKNYVRPWDIGKEGVRKKQHYEMTQKEWVEKQRKERPKEFAPPQTYRTEFRGAPKDSYQSSREDKTLKFTTKKRSADDNHARKSDKVPEVDSMGDSFREAQGIPCDSHYKNIKKSNETSCANTNADTRGKGVEIAPPLTYDYYGPSPSKMKKSTSENNDIEKSIEAGLHFLRKQMEEKQKSTNHPSEMYLL